MRHELLGVRSRRALLPAATALLLAVASACGASVTDEDSPGWGFATAPPGWRADGGREVPPLPPRPVCFPPAEPPTATALDVGGDAGDGDAGDAGDGGATRLLRIDVTWPVSHIHVDSSRSTSASIVETTSTERETRLSISVPAGATEAQLTLNVSCNPHLGADVFLSLVLTKDPIVVVVGVQ